WRPRRRHEKAREQGERRPQWRKKPDDKPVAAAAAATVPAGQEAAAPTPQTGRRERRGGDGKDRPPRRWAKTDRPREPRPSQQTKPAGGPPRTAVADPDSPFAKLGALKQMLEQRAREQNSS
ncbi:MAG: hypothetical protein ACREC6_12660, partial [Hyphomicrobiaceae bacterium]